MDDKPGTRLRYFIAKGGCPEWARCGGEGPLILTICPHCETITATCGETDDKMGIYAKPGSLDVTPRADRSEWDSCPSCGGEVPGPCYATEEELIAFGFPSSGLKRFESHSESPGFRYIDCDW